MLSILAGICLASFLIALALPEVWTLPSLWAQLFEVVVLNSAFLVVFSIRDLCSKFTSLWSENGKFFLISG